MPSILIIDDDDSLRDALRRTLHKEGYTISEACEGRQGLKELEHSPVDLILLDMFMPDKDGLETIGELRRTYPKIRIIAMSGGGIQMHGRCSARCEKAGCSTNAEQALYAGATARCRA